MRCKARLLWNAGHESGRGTWGSKGGGSDSGTQGTASLGASRARWEGENVK